METSAFVVYEIRTPTGLNLIASREVRDQIPPPGATREVGRVLGASSEAQAVRVAEQADYFTEQAHKYKFSSII